MKAYRQEKGLCFKCGEKWSRQHTCPQQVPLHIIEELLEVLDCSDDRTSDDELLTSPVDSSLMAVAPTQPVLKKRRTMQFKGLIGKQEVLILVDFGSVASFVSSSVVQQQQLPVTPISQETYSVADGGSVQCGGMVQGLQWLTQGHSFSQHMRVLTLGCFDIILGADWLEDKSYVDSLETQEDEVHSQGL